MSEIIKFGKTLKQIELKTGTVMKLPEYCTHRISSYQFNKENNTVEIICKECKKAYTVLKLQEGDDGSWSWIDAHKEIEYHFMGDLSGYSPICVECKNNLPKTDKNKKKNINKKNDEEKLPYTVFLTAENKKYLQLYRIVYDEDITDVINLLVENLRKDKPIEIKTK